jgi:hypothetical protein
MSAGGGEIDGRIGRPFAGEGDMAVGEPEAAAGQAELAPDQVDRASDLRSRGRALDAQIGAPLGIEAHAGDVDLVVGAEADVQPPDAWHALVRILLVGRLERLAAAAHAGELRHLGGGLADDLVARLAEIERAADRARRCGR